MENKIHPLNNVLWVEREKLKPNNYNPNKVAPPELTLLKISILEDGWTQPIVINSNYEIVDGYHRWTVSADPKINKLTGGKVPVVMIESKGRNDYQMATIRHNRARGTHAVLNMAEIVCEMVKNKIPKEEIMLRLQMEEEEVIRLALQKGIPETDIITNSTFSNSWGV